MHAEYRGGNPFTGWQVWYVRDIPTNRFGDDWIASATIEKRSYFASSLEVCLAKDFNQRYQFRGLRDIVRQMGFKRAWALRHGRIKHYGV